MYLSMTSVLLVVAEVSPLNIHTLTIVPLYGGRHRKVLNAKTSMFPLPPSESRVRVTMSAVQAVHDTATT